MTLSLYNHEYHPICSQSDSYCHSYKGKAPIWALESVLHRMCSKPSLPLVLQEVQMNTAHLCSPELETQLRSSSMLGQLSINDSVLLCFILGRVSLAVTQAGLELKILLIQPP